MMNTLCSLKLANDKVENSQNIVFVLAEVWQETI